MEDYNKFKKDIPKDFNVIHRDKVLKDLNKK